MFVGHYSAALAAKAAQPRGPLWTYVAAAQLVDIGWSVLVLGGIEKLRIDPSLPGSALDLYHMPWTHSLPAAVLWSVAALVLCRWLLKLPWGAAVAVGLVVFSHWLLDLIVHRPDLALWFDGAQKVGFGLWNLPVPEQALEMGLLAIGGMAWAWTRGQAGRTAWPALLFVGLLVALQIVVLFMPPSEGPIQMGVSALGAYLVVTAIAWLVDRGKRA